VRFTPAPHRIVCRNDPLPAAAGSPERQILQDLISNLQSYKRNGNKYGFQYSPEAVRLSTKLLLACGRTQYRTLSHLFLLQSESSARE